MGGILNMKITTKITTKTLTRSALILALAIAIQSIRMPAYVTGPLVNALIILASALISPISGVMVGLLTPLLAFSFGIMALAPAVPIIMLGNALLAIVYGLLKKKPILGIICAAVLKYASMTFGFYYILPNLMGIKLPAKILPILTTQQLITAIVGGIIAVIIIKALNWGNKK